MPTALMNNETQQSFACSQLDCPLTKSGMCLEGLSIEECPHVYTDKEEEVFIPENVADSGLVEGVSLFSGDELMPDQLTDVTYANPTQLVVIMGEPECGKTTILASLFDLFQKGTFGPYWFAGSQTQIGFEKRCHLSRMASGRLTPDTERTRSSEFSYLHLAIRPMPDPVRHMLFTDVSGERFRLARDSAQEMEQLAILGQADQLFCVLDGGRLSINASRQVSKANLVTLLNRIEQNSSFPKGKGLFLLVNKWDIIVEQNQEEAVERNVITPLRSRFPTLIHGVIQICARPTIAGKIEFGFGYESFLSHCTATASSHHSNEKIAPSEREFARFASRF